MDNTSDINKNVNSATKLTTARTISLGGDATGSANFDGSTNISINSTLKNVGTAGVQKPKVTTDAQGRIISSSELTATDIPSLDHNKITDFDNQVKSIPLNNLGAPIGFMNMAGHRVTGVKLEPTSDSDVITKYHFDKNILTVQLCAIYKNKPFGNSLYNEQVVVQAWYDKYKSKSGYKSPDTTNPLELCPELPPVQVGKIAVWLGDTTWYWKQGDGGNTTWSGMTKYNFKQPLAFAVEYIALGTPLRDGKLDVIYADDVINAHATNANNPHNTTKSQVGLGNVDNTSDADKPASRATLNELALKQNINDDTLKTSNKFVSGAINELYNHSISGSNPHSTTKAQVGLGSVDNTSDASKNVLSATKLTTPRKINGVDFDGSKDITLSKSNFSDLNLVDNTSDKNKPISTATQTALNDKQSKEDLNLRTKSKSIVGAINDLSEMDSIQSWYPVYQMTPPLRYPASDGGSQAEIQAWHDKNKSKLGYISEDSATPLGKYPSLPIVPVGVTAVWLGDTTWYTKAGDGTRNCWMYMNPTRKCDFYSKICIALGSTFNEAKASVADVNGKVDIVQGKSLISNAELSRLSTLTNYTHPTSHPASMITGLASVATSGSYNSLTGTPTLSKVATSGAFGDLLYIPGTATFNHAGFMSGADKAKLDDLPRAYLYATLNSSFNPTTGKIGFGKIVVNYDNLIKNSNDGIYFSLPSKGVFEITARLGLDSNTTAISYRIYNEDTPVGMLGEAVDMKGYGCVFSEAFHVVDMSKETTNNFNVRVTWDNADVIAMDNSFLKIVQVR